MSNMLLQCNTIAEKCQVLLQAMKEDPPLDAKCRDKFLVQSAMVNDADSANGADGANVASLVCLAVSTTVAITVATLY